MSDPPAGDNVSASEAGGHLPPAVLAVVHVLEGCIAARHVASVTYRRVDGVEEQLTVRPAFFRYNHSHHLVLWWMPEDEDRWAELRVDGLEGAVDTGRAFTPAWE